MENNSSDSHQHTDRYRYYARSNELHGIKNMVAGALDAVSGGFGLDAVSVCVDDALDALCDLTGENASENVINEVFERFCVGK